MRARQSRRAWAGLIVFAWLFSGIHPALTPSGISWQTPQANAGSVLYVNDAAGRLAAVIDPASNAAVYKYDAVGNILSINQYPATQVSIITVNPNNSTGSQAQVCGTGFSSTLSQNTVSFNGVTGTVLSVSGACLIVSVPSNATTGTVMLTTPTGSATSSASYVVRPPAPTITGFTPAIGDVGTTVTVSGSMLNPVAGATTVALGFTSGVLASLSNSQLAFAVPSNAGSGPIQVATPYGAVTSVTDFIVPPSAIGATNVLSYATLTVNGGAQSLDVSTSNKYGVFALNATAGQLLNLRLTSLTTTPSDGTVYYQVYSPTNVQIGSGSVNAASNMLIHLPAISTTGRYTAGTYLVAFNSGSGTVQLSATLEIAPALTVGGTTNVSAAASDGSTYLSFTATVGQNLALGITGLTLAPGTGYATVYVYWPNGITYLTSASCNPTKNGCDLDFMNLPETGTYTVIVTPIPFAAMSLKATLTADVSATLIAYTPLNVNLALPGQEALLSFSAAAGQNLALAVDGINTIPAGTYVTYAVYAPNGTTSVSASQHSPNGDTFDLQNLVAGIYTVRIIPDYAATATLTLTLTNGHDGDLNGDGIVDVADIALAERMTLDFISPTFNQLIHGDVAPAPAGGDWRIDTADVARIRRKALGLENF